LKREPWVSGIRTQGVGVIERLAQRRHLIGKMAQFGGPMRGISRVGDDRYKGGIPHSKEAQEA